MGDWLAGGKGFLLRGYRSAHALVQADAPQGSGPPLPCRPGRSVLQPAHHQGAVPRDAQVPGAAHTRGLVHAAQLRLWAVDLVRRQLQRARAGELDSLSELAFVWGPPRHGGWGKGGRLVQEESALGRRSASDLTTALCCLVPSSPTPQCPDKKWLVISTT